MKVDSPPSPPGRMLFGHSFEFTSDPLGSLKRWSEEYGDVVQLSFPGRTVVLVTDPDYVRRIIEKDAECFSVGSAREEAFRGIEEGALVVSRGDDWKRQRRIMQSFFTPRAVKEYPQTILRETDRLLDSWEPGRELDLYDQMSSLTIRIVARCLMGVDMKGREEPVKQGANAVIERSDATNPQRMIPTWIPTPQNRRFQRAKRNLYELIDGVIAERKQTSETTDTLLDRLIEANENGELSDQQLRANTCSFFLAGSDTSSAALTYTLFCLGNHPEVLGRLRQTIDQKFSRDAFDPGGVADVPDVRHAVQEAMRLYPPAFSIGREATEEYVLDGYRIPEGAQLLLSQWVIQRDERVFEDPKAYRPSRWKNREGWPKYAHFPFGGGDRFCIGSHFAMMEMPIIVARMLQTVDFEVLTETIEDFVPAATLRPAHPVKLMVSGSRTHNSPGSAGSDDESGVGHRIPTSQSNETEG